MSHQVYRLLTIPSSTDAYNTGRTETWSSRKDQQFSSLEDAKDYVRAMNLAHSELPRFLCDFKTDEEKEEVIDSFCFDDSGSLHLRRFFLGKPDREKLIASLHEQGIITVIRP